ncbi:hypothetical protein STEG23_008874, partial [Scotinomys teguina]
GVWLCCPRVRCCGKMASHLRTFSSLAGSCPGSISLVGYPSHSVASLCESVMQKYFAVTHSDWIVFQ